MFVLKFLFLVGHLLSATVVSEEIPGRWSVERMTEWQQKEGWKAGSNFIPSNAVNQLEMWQPATYDPVTIDRELGWAEDLGFNVMRVYLHDLLWNKDGSNKEFLDRINDFLSIAHKHNIKIMFVFFDSCWIQKPIAGKQPKPKKGVHNSQWLQSPGFIVVRHPDRFAELESYVTGVMSHFKDDTRIFAWDLWNEPNNPTSSKYTDDLVMPRLKSVIKWARGVNPSQPLTIPIFQDTDKQPYTEFHKFCLDNSDLLSFHNYNDLQRFYTAIQHIARHSPGRPVACTEYLARTMGSGFQPHLQLMQYLGVYAMNWGLVTGKTNTRYDWNDTPLRPAEKEPKVWFHDILRSDGKAFSKKETDYIQKVMFNEMEKLEFEISPATPASEDTDDKSKGGDGSKKDEL